MYVYRIIIGIMSAVALMVCVHSWCFLFYYRLHNTQYALIDTITDSTNQILTQESRPNGESSNHSLAKVNGSLSLPVDSPIKGRSDALPRDGYNVRDFGAIGDGISHSAETVLGISTLAELAEYSAADGKKPYAWLTAGADPTGNVNGFPFGNLFNLQVSRSTKAGATVLDFGITHVVGIAQLTTEQIPSGATKIPVNTWKVTNDVSTATSTCWKGPLTISASTSTTITLRSSVGGCAKGTPVTMSVGPQFGGYETYLTDIDGVQVDDLVTGTGVPVNTTVELVNYATGAIRTSKPLRSSAGDALTFVPRWLENIRVGMHVYAGKHDRQSVITYFGSKIFSIANPYTKMHSFYVGQAVNLLGKVAPGGFTLGKTYYISPEGLTDQRFGLAAISGGDAITATSAGEDVVISPLPGQGSGTVARIDETRGSVTLSASTLPPLQPPSFKRPVGSTVTFFAPWTDAQAASLTMDWLGIEAAMQKAGHYGGIYVPNGRYQINEPLETVLAISGDDLPTQEGTTINGAGEAATSFQATRDFGPGVAILSPGDPSGAQDNGRGAYSHDNMFGTGADWGSWSDFTVQVEGATSNVKGIRPCLGTAQCWPINSAGLRTIQNHTYRNIFVSHTFKNIDFVGGHIVLDNIRSTSGYYGIYFSPDNANPYDFVFHAVELGQEMWAGIGVNADAEIAQLTADKLYVGYSPYGIYVEAGLGTGIQSALKHADIRFLDAEGVSCGVFVDGNGAPNDLSTGMHRLIQSVTIGSLLANSDSLKQPIGGCQADAQLVAASVVGLDLELNDVFDSFIVPYTGGKGFIKTYSLDDRRPDGVGGIVLKGAGVGKLIQDFSSVCQEIVTSGGRYGDDAAASIFLNTNQGLKVRLETPLWQARLVPQNDAGLASARIQASASIGMAMELNEFVPFNSAGVQRSGLAAPGTKPFAGLNVGNYGSCPYIAGLELPVASSGEQVPVAVSSNNRPGNLLKISSEKLGKADTAISMTDGIVIGSVTSTATYYNNDQYAGTNMMRLQLR